MQTNELYFHLVYSIGLRFFFLSFSQARFLFCDTTCNTTRSMGYKKRLYKKHSLISRKKLETVSSFFEKIKEQSNPCCTRYTGVFHQGKKHFDKTRRITIFDSPENLKSKKKLKKNVLL